MLNNIYIFFQLDLYIRKKLNIIYSIADTISQCDMERRSQSKTQMGTASSLAHDAPKSHTDHVSDHGSNIGNDVGNEDTSVNSDLEWKRVFNKIVSYLSEHKVLPVTREYSWIFIQRSKYKNKTLEQWKITALESVDGWYWDHVEYSWWKKYTEVKKIIEKKLSISNSKHYKWYLSQKKQYIDDTLSRERIRALEQIKGWECYMKDAQDKWQLDFDRILKLYKRNKARTILDEKAWFYAQRKRYTRKTIQNYQILAIEKNFDGWVWNVSQNIWQTNYDKLLKYVNDNGAFPPHRKNSWFALQLRRYRNGGFKDEEKILKLEKIPGWHEIVKYKYMN